MRRDVRGHADGDAGGAVDQQVRNPRRQHGGLALRAVVVVHEVDGVAVDVEQHLLGDGGEPRLGVAHRGGRVVVDRAEVSLAVDERVAHGEVLRHPDEGVVDRRVAMRVELPEHLADDAGALLVRGAGAQSHPLHGVEDAPVHGLEPVPYVGQSSRHDDAHGVVEIRRAHLDFNGDGTDVA